MGPRAANNRLNDDALVSKTREGDVQAFEQLVCHYQDRVFQVCLRICGHYESARDLAQETFLRAYTHIGTFEGKCRFYTWLFRIAVNLSISHRRTSLRLQVHSFQPDESGNDSGYPASMAGQGLRLNEMMHGNNNGQPSDIVRRQETRAAVTAALGELDSDQRTILVLRDVEGMDYQAIAEILNVPVGTVRSRLHRARLAMRELLKPVLEKVV